MQCLTGKDFSFEKSFHFSGKAPCIAKSSKNRTIETSLRPIMLFACLMVQWQLHGKNGSPARGGLEKHLPAMPFHYGIDRASPCPVPLPTSLVVEKGSKIRPGISREFPAGSATLTVRNASSRFVRTVMVPNFPLLAPRISRCLSRVEDEIQENLPISCGRRASPAVRGRDPGPSLARPSSVAADQ
jgi:hypothetical protein